MAVLPTAAIYADDGIYASYDFEDCEIGDKPNGWSITESQGSKICVDYDDVSKSKALKLVIGKTQTVNKAVLNFDNTDGGIVKISYDMRAENHSRWALDKPGWGSAYNDNTPVTFNAFYKNSLIGYGAWGSVGANYTIVPNLNMKKDYINVTQYIDFDNHTYKQYIDGVLKSAGSGNNWVFQNNTDSINNLVFFVRANAINSGTSSDGTEDNNGVYWIDNIIVEKPALDVVSVSVDDGTEKVPVNTEEVNILFSDTIDETTITNETICVTCDGVPLSEDEYSLNVNDTAVSVVFAEKLKYDSYYEITATTLINEGTSYNRLRKDYVFGFRTIDEESASIINPILVNEDFEKYNIGTKSIDGIDGNYSVETDGEHGKALRFTNGGNIKIKFGDSTQDKVIVTYKYRSENHVASPALAEFGTVRGNNGIAVRTIVYQNSMLTYYEPTDTTNVGTGSVANSDNYHTMQYIIDMTQKSTKVIFDGEELSRTYAFWNSGVTALNSITFNPQGAGGIYWIDDISVEYEHLKILNSTPKNGALRVGVDTQPVIVFDETLNESTINKNSVKIFEDDIQMSEDEYSLSADNEQLKIVFGEPMNDGSEYKIRLSNKIAGKSGLNLMSPVEIVYTANISNPFLIERTVSGTAIEGQKLSVKYDIENISNTDADLAHVLIFYDSCGAMTGAAADSKRICAKTKDMLISEVTVPENTSYAISYIWRASENGRLNMNPVCEAYKISN